MTEPVCTPCTPPTAASVAMPACADMMARAVAGYDAVITGLMSGQRVIEVQFGEQKVKYDSTEATATMLRKQIARYHQSCPTAASAAILGLGGGSLAVQFGNCALVRCGC